jgi:hypothetical protein
MMPTPKTKSAINSSKTLIPENSLNQNPTMHVDAKTVYIYVGVFYNITTSTGLSGTQTINTV